MSEGIKNENGHYGRGTMNEGIENDHYPHILGWWEGARAGTKDPADFAKAVGRLPLGIKAMMADLVARARESGLLNAPAELDEVGTALVALAVAMRPPGDSCTLSSKLIEDLLRGGSPPMAVPLYLGSALSIRVSEGHAAHGYFPPGFDGLLDLTVAYYGETEWVPPRLPESLNRLALASGYPGKLVLDAPGTAVRQLDCTDCRSVAIGAPTEELRLIRCEGADLSRLVRDAAGAAVKVEGDPRGGVAVGLDLGRDDRYYPSVSLGHVAVRGNARAGRLVLYNVQLHGQLAADEARIEGVTGDGQLVAKVSFNRCVRRT